MTAPKIIAGLQIIENARPKDESPYHVRAEHDEIFAGSLEWDMTEADKDKLEELGWSEREDVDGWRAYV